MLLSEQERGIEGEGDKLTGFSTLPHSLLQQNLGQGDNAMKIKPSGVHVPTLWGLHTFLGISLTGAGKIQGLVYQTPNKRAQ